MKRKKRAYFSSSCLALLQESLMLQCGLHAVLTLHTTHPNSCAALRKVCYKAFIMVWVEDAVLSSEEFLLTILVIITAAENATVG